MGKVTKYAALVLCMAAVTAFGQTEMLTNPDLDDAGAPWAGGHLAGQTWVDVGSSYSVNGGEAHLNTSGNGTFVMFQRVNLAAGATYTYTVDYDVTAEFPANNGSINLVLVPGSDVDDDGSPSMPVVTVDEARAVTIDGINAWATGQPIPVGPGQFTGEFQATGTGGASTSFAIVFTLQCWAGSGNGAIDVSRISVMGAPVGGEGEGEGEGSGFRGGFAEVGSTIDMCAPDGGTGYTWSYSGSGEVSQGGALMQNPDFNASAGWQTAVDSWAGSSVDFIGGKFNIHHGGQANVSVYQVVTLDQGAQYDVSFVYQLLSAADNFGVELLAIDPSSGATYPPGGDWAPYRLNANGNWGNPVASLGPLTMSASYTAPGTLGGGTVDIAFLAIWYSWSSPQAFEATIDDFNVNVPGGDSGVAGMPVGFTGDVNSQCLLLENLTDDYTGTYTCSYDDGSKAPQVYSVSVTVVESLPVASILGLGLLAGASVLAGTIAIRRRKK